MSSPDMKQRLQEQQDWFMTQLITAWSTYWTALLTGNGFLLATLSIVIAVRGPSAPPWHTAVIVFALFLNLLAILGLLLCCFKSDRDHYRDLVLEGPEPPPATAETLRAMAESRRTTLRRHRLRTIFENVAVVTIVMSVIAVAVVLCT